MPISDNDGYDVEVICHMICCCINSSNNKHGDILTIQNTLKDVRKTLLEREQINYYGGRKRSSGLYVDL